MKSYLLSLILGTSLFLTQSCTQSIDDNQNQATTQNVTSGTWRVTLFTDSGNDETGDFTGYSFDFNSGGSLSATRNGTTQTGTWNVNSSGTKFNINLGAKTDANKPLGELTDDWKVISISSSEIKLTDDNPASAEFLTFVKN